MANELIVNLLLTVGIIGFIVYLKFRKEKPGDEYNDIYLEVMNSDKYKVKGKFE